MPGIKIIRLCSRIIAFFIHSRAVSAFVWLSSKKREGKKGGRGELLTVYHTITIYQTCPLKTLWEKNAGYSIFSFSNLRREIPFIQSVTCIFAVQ